MKVRRLLISVLLFVTGFSLGRCVINTRSPQAGPVDMVCLADSLEWSVELWRSEIARRYPGAVGLVCHGGDMGHWTLHPDHRRLVLLPTGPIPFYLQDRPFPVEQEIAVLRAKYPGRRIVLVVCNPGHYRLNIPGVSYALESVWAVPDRSLNPRSQQHPEDVGNVFEFQER